MKTIKYGQTVEMTDRFGMGKTYRVKVVSKVFNTNDPKVKKGAYVSYKRQVWIAGLVEDTWCLFGAESDYSIKNGVYAKFYIG